MKRLLQLSAAALAFAVYALWVLVETVFWLVVCPRHLHNPEEGVYIP